MPPKKEPPIIGRESEIKSLMSSKKMGRGQLIVCMGRRRIGKSFLIRHVGQKWNHYIEIQGLAPAKGITNQDQINNFVKQTCEQSNYPPTTVRDWDSAFRLLGKIYEGKEVLIFLDEISWMGNKDPKFTSILKIVWDTLFSLNKKLTLVLCGSVSSWIEENILKDTNFLGRISMTIKLNELSIQEADGFFSKETSELEKLKFLLITGGVPRYLEECQNFNHPTQALSKLFLRKEGFLFNEYEKIFIDIFGKRHQTYARLIDVLQDSPKTFLEICNAADLPKNGKTSNYLHQLEISGFLRRNGFWDLQSQKSRRGDIYRISDNYLRFYKRAIVPLKRKIEQNLLPFKTIDQIPNFNAILGYQLETLVYNNIKIILNILAIELEELVNWGPYRQTKTLRSEACQIDLLIQTKTVIYIFEIKYNKKIDSKVIQEINLKKEKLKYNRKTHSVKTGIIYTHDIENTLFKKRPLDFFISMNQFFSANSINTRSTINKGVG